MTKAIKLTFQAACATCIHRTVCQKHLQQDECCESWLPVLTATVNLVQDFQTKFAEADMPEDPLKAFMENYVRAKEEARALQDALATVPQSAAASTYIRYRQMLIHALEMQALAYEQLLQSEASVQPADT